MTEQVASGQTQTQKSYHTEGRTTNGSLGGIQRLCLSIQDWIQESQIQMEWNLDWGFEDKNKYTREQKEDQGKRESSAE